MKIDNSTLSVIAVRTSQYPEDNKPEFLLVGRSNVGKSSFINTGYGYAAVDKVTQKKFGLMIEEYLINRPNLKRVFMVIDARIKPTENDLIMYNYLKHYNIPVTVVATKFDKIKAKDRDKTLKNINLGMKLVEEDQLVYFSSITKKGREDIYNIIDTELKKNV